MIASVRGHLLSTATDSVVVSVGGLGLRLLAPLSTLRSIGPVGETVQLHTHLHLREDNISLFGFLTLEELTLFEQLITVTGVGPRLALSILSGGSVDALRSAIAAGNADLLTKVPGIGKKLVGRLILELKGKVDLGISTSTGIGALGGGEVAEILSALTSLGYTLAEAQEALRSVPDDSSFSTEDKILRALRYFSR